MDITLPQAILLLSLNDETGKTEDGYYQPALAGAALAELILSGAIELQETPQAVIPLRHNAPLGAFLSMCDKAIGSAPKPSDLNTWIAQLANQKDFIATLADELCHIGALSREETRVFGLFTRTVWPEASPALEQALKRDMAHAMFEDAGPVDEKLCLTIALANAVDLLSHNFAADDLARHADRVVAISAGNCLSASSSDAVMDAVNRAVRAAHAVADSINASILN
ncbi:MAG: GPP34 family phosphoprotein [Pseudomonadota bacterium]